jgi:hypothetical protein
MQCPAAIGQRPLFCAQVLELIDRRSVGGALTVDKVDSGLEGPSLRRHDSFLLEQPNQLVPISLREVKELVIGQCRRSFSQLDGHGKPVHEERRLTVAEIAHHV